MSAPRELPAVLFIDDDERILRSLQVLFRPHYRVMTTTDPEEALALVRQEPIKVVVSDQRMPQMMGAELLRQVREIAPDTVRILLTGYSDSDAAVAALNDGGIWRYLAKPWTVESIQRTLRDAVAVAESLGALPEMPEVPESHSREVLVIDDDPDTIATVRSAAPPGTVIHAAANLTTAVQILGTRPIAVVVTEVMVNGDDMTHLLRTLKMQQPHVLSIVLTGVRDTSRLIRLINQAQVYRYLPKPARTGILAKGLETALARRGALARTAMAAPADSRVEDADTETGRTLSRRIGDYLVRLRSRAAVPAA